MTWDYAVLETFFHANLIIVSISLLVNRSIPEIWYSTHANVISLISSIHLRMITGWSSWEYNLNFLESVGLSNSTNNSVICSLRSHEFCADNVSRVPINRLICCRITVRCPFLITTVCSMYSRLIGHSDYPEKITEILLHIGGVPLAKTSSEEKVQEDVILVTEWHYLLMNTPSGWFLYFCEALSTGTFFCDIIVIFRVLYSVLIPHTIYALPFLCLWHGLWRLLLWTIFYIHWKLFPH